MSQILTLTNHLLIAMPSLEDPNFCGTVTYICEHSEQGAAGIIINKSLAINMEEALSQMNIIIHSAHAKKQSLFYGGPLQQERGFVIHRSHGKWRATIRTSDGIAVTSSKDILQSIAYGEGPQNVIVALGYAGWSANQLEDEMKDNAWLSIPAESDILFNVPQDRKWELALNALGINVDQLLYQVGYA